MPELGEVAEAIKQFHGDARRAAPLASVLGFEPFSTPADLLAGHTTPLTQFFDSRSDRFGVDQLYRVGGTTTGTGSVGLYVAGLTEWGMRSSDRDRPRRRIARALVEYQTQDARSIFIMVSGAEQRRREAEFVLPRSTADLRGKRTSESPVSTVRALVDLEEPTRFHRDLLKEIAVLPGVSLLDISQQWQKAFSVERATRLFYQEYARIRDYFAQVLKVSNADHPVVGELTSDEARAWATRQMGRILFLWFLQAKQWLGYDGTGQGSPNYLQDLWTKRDQATDGYYRGMLIPLFFEALARRNPGQEVRNILGYTPYLNGGLFRRNRLEDRVHDGGEVTLPDELFDPRGDMSVLGLLSQYRFTTRESTPDDQSVDPDPELLGRVFENLYQGDERHDTGTYYTPREVVHFMCRQVLDGYLCNTAGIDQDTLNWLRRQVTEPEEEKSPLPPATEESLINALEGGRICDPAVGSGAFLLGMMQEIVQLRRGILHSRNYYIEPAEEDKLVATWKRRAIQWSLYGVDINPEAVEICQLRLWLSLILDMVDPREVDPLPNLDFRIVAGDSLVDRVADIDFRDSLPREGRQIPMELNQRVQHEEERIDQWRREFEATQDNPARLRKLRDNIANAYKRIIRFHIDTALDKAREEVQLRQGMARKKVAITETRVAQLEHLLKELGKEDAYQKPFLWPVAFPEVFQYGGFDIVLANPPYVRQEKLSPEDQDSYKLSFKEVFAGTADILTFFYARSMQILKNEGWLAFITSNKYMRAAYGEGLREQLTQQLRVQRVIDFGDLPIFDANGKPVASYPAVLVGRKDGYSEDNVLHVADLTIPIRSALAATERKANPENVRWALEDLGGILVDNEISDYPQVLLRKERWILEDPALVRLFERLMNQGTPLGQFVKGRIYRGVLTGLNEAFVIDQAKRDDLVAEDQRSAELIKPWLRGQDIKRWQVDWAGLYVIAIQSSSDADANNPWANSSSENEARQIFREMYPAIYDHLSWWEEYPDPKQPGKMKGLRPRLDQGRFWWELRACAYYSEFEQSKIIWPDITSEMRFAWDSTKYYLANTAYAGVGPQWLVSLFNSTVLEFVSRIISTSIRGGYIRLIYQTVAPLPIIEPPKDIQARLSALLDLEEESREREVDDLAAAVYNLSNDEMTQLREWKARLSLMTSEDVEEVEENE